MLAAVLLLPAAVQLASAHFQLEYPEWRSDSLAEGTTYSQWDYPCAGVPYGAGNKTEWPLGSGAVVLDLHHPWTYVYVNLGLGENTTNFNISLTPNLLNVTGNGTFCLPDLPLPTTISEGQNGTIQVVTNGQSGSALYNKVSSDVCTNSTGVTGAIVGQATKTNSSSTPSPTPTGAAPGTLGSVSLAAVIGMAVASIMVVVM
ncbi:hypothetical protein F5Y19DRAFT_476098 [Xylariaceae sp. FL1651]|nr:hypothetical protein F5Y19DRAFT_476098 [Xylariaceae sp. FL1651]